MDGHSERPAAVPNAERTRDAPMRESGDDDDREPERAASDAERDGPDVSGRYVPV
jgi:hypothetical protein